MANYQITPQVHKKFVALYDPGTTPCKRSVAALEHYPRNQHVISDRLTAAVIKHHLQVRQGTKIGQCGNYLLLTVRLPDKKSWLLYDVAHLPGKFPFKIEPHPTLDLTAIQISGHALMRFRERYQWEHTPLGKNVPSKLEMIRLLSLSKPEELSIDEASQKLRLYGRVPQFFRFDRYRFVIDEVGSEKPGSLEIKTFFPIV